MHGREMHGLLHPFLLLPIFERPGHGYDLIDRLKAMGLPDVGPATSTASYAAWNASGR